jgi:hypothetical protein
MTRDNDEEVLGEDGQMLMLNAILVAYGAKKVESVSVLSNEELDAIIEDATDLTELFSALFNDVLPHLTGIRKDFVEALLIVIGEKQHEAATKAAGKTEVSDGQAPEEHEAAGTTEVSEELDPSDSKEPATKVESVVPESLKRFEEDFDALVAEPDPEGSRETHILCVTQKPQGSPLPLRDMEKDEEDGARYRTLRIARSEPRADTPSSLATTPQPPDTDPPAPDPAPTGASASGMPTSPGFMALTDEEIETVVNEVVSTPPPHSVSVIDTGASGVAPTTLGLVTPSGVVMPTPKPPPPSPWDAEPAAPRGSLPLPRPPITAAEEPPDSVPTHEALIANSKKLTRMFPPPANPPPPQADPYVSPWDQPGYVPPGPTFYDPSPADDEPASDPVPVVEPRQPTTVNEKAGGHEEPAEAEPQGRLSDAEAPSLRAESQRARRARNGSPAPSSPAANQQATIQPKEAKMWQKIAVLAKGRMRATLAAFAKVNWRRQLKRLAFVAGLTAVGLAAVFGFRMLKWPTPVRAMPTDEIMAEISRASKGVESGTVACWYANWSETVPTDNGPYLDCQEAEEVPQKEDCYDVSQCVAVVVRPRWFGKYASLW